MALKGLFRKKTIHDIMKQVEQNESDGHNALGKHLTARDLTAFGIAAIVGAGIFSTIGKASADGGPGLFSCFYLLLWHVVLQLLLMLSLLRWFLFQDRLIRIRMSLLAKSLLGL
jgi:amino acid permease